MVTGSQKIEGAYLTGCSLLGLQANKKVLELVSKAAFFVLVCENPVNEAAVPDSVPRKSDNSLLLNPLVSGLVEVTANAEDITILAFIAKVIVAKGN